MDADTNPTQPWRCLKCMRPVEFVAVSSLLSLKVEGGLCEKHRSAIVGRIWNIPRAEYEALKAKQTKSEP